MHWGVAPFIVCSVGYDCGYAKYIHGPIKGHHPFVDVLLSDMMFFSLSYCTTLLTA